MEKCRGCHLYTSQGYVWDADVCMETIRAYCDKWAKGLVEVEVPYQPPPKREPTEVRAGKHEDGYYGRVGEGMALYRQAYGPPPVLLDSEVREEVSGEQNDQSPF